MTMATTDEKMTSVVSTSPTPSSIRSSDNEEDGSEVEILEVKPAAKIMEIGEDDDEVVASSSASGNAKVVAGGDSLASLPSPSPRRSTRERKKTTMVVDGHTILRKNNYRVTQGEYIYGDCDEEDEDTIGAGPVRKKPKKTTTTSTSTPNKPRELNQSEVARKDHNQIIKSMVQPKHVLRDQFFSKHIQILQPFLEPKVLDRLMKSTESTSKLPPPSLPAVTKTPSMITATLRPYQMKGLEFMIKMHEQNLAMILGDEMGLGKTLQTIALLCHLKEQEQITGPSLIICPLSVLSSWCNEMSKWAPKLKFFRMHASNAEEQMRQKQILYESATKYDVILTTYEMAKLPTLTYLYQRITFHYVVLDEGHKIKGHETQLAQVIRKIHTGNKLLLTGTPLQNNLVELWSLLNFLFPDVFTTLEPFAANFDLNENKINKSFLMKTQRLLELFMLRRLKKEVETMIPPKLETKVYCPLSKTQIFWYKALLMKDVSSLEKIDGSNNAASSSAAAAASSSASVSAIPKSKHTVLRSLFMQLRKCCSHPFLFDGSEDNPDETSVEDLVSASGKLSVLDMLLQSLFKRGNRCVLFTQFTMLLNLIEDYCVMRGWKYCRLDGATNRARRSYLIDRFNEPNSPYFLFLMSTRSGGMGLNLQTADTCILFDSDWNPQCDIQAMGRVHRIGQKKTVHVYRLVSSGTIEERMLERAEKKLLLEMVNRESSKQSMGTDEDDMGAARGMSSEELLEDIKFGCEAIFGASTNNNKLPSWKDIDTITDRARKESDSIGQLQGNASKTAKSFDASQEFSETQHFGGIDFRSIRQKVEEKEQANIPKNLKSISHLWKEIKDYGDKKRVKKSRVVMIDGKGSGYGGRGGAVPVLASNNYDLQHGESSVFDRELNNRADKSAYGVKKRKKAQPKFDNQDFCQVCGDGGFLALCPRCPCSVHLECVGLKCDRDFLHCPHHRCHVCHRSSYHAGGMLYPCEACSLSFCEDCLPKKGVTYLEKIGRFEELGYPSKQTRHVYIHCSNVCRNYSKHELGYVPPKTTKGKCPPRLNLEYNFGASNDLDKAQSAIQAKKEEENASGIRTRSGGKREPPAHAPRKAGGGIPVGKPRTPGTPVEKICPNTLAVVEQFDSLTAAAQSVGKFSASLSQSMLKKPGQQFQGFYWRHLGDEVWRPDEARLPAAQVSPSVASPVEKIDCSTLRVLKKYDTLDDAAKFIGTYGAKRRLDFHMRENYGQPFEGFYWRYLGDTSWRPASTSASSVAMAQPRTKKGTFSRHVSLSDDDSAGKTSSNSKAGKTEDCPIELD